MTRFTLSQDQWYACLSFGDDYKASDLIERSWSPILVRNVVPLGTGKREYSLEYVDSSSPDSPIERTYTLRTVNRGRSGLLAAVAGSHPVRYLYITAMDSKWIDQLFPHIVSRSGESTQGAGVRGGEGKLRFANKSTWKCKPMPRRRQQLDYHRHFSDAEMSRIRQGFIPQMMEDKWFAYFEDCWLYQHRSWTGHCIYQVRFTAQPEDWTVAEAWVNRDESEYQCSDDAEDLKSLDQLLSSLIASEFKA
ncbi:hypothetical protein [Stieleria mannarensis]|uniref:hypothetical protein n=1 Tax=Stieleria mannarensis TaxID=2755585 RepID=UPI001601969D|nr:hypothetical protein [Rhodopirellula sp. JC639]